MKNIFLALSLLVGFTMSATGPTDPPAKKKGDKTEKVCCSKDKSKSEDKKECSTASGEKKACCVSKKEK